MRICVVGAGVSGLTTSLVLAEGGCQVDIATLDADVERDSGKTNLKTTSSVAAALWYPFSIFGFYKRAWALATFRRFRQLIRATAAGVTTCEFLDYYEESHDLSLTFDEHKWWLVDLKEEFQVEACTAHRDFVFCKPKPSRSGAAIALTSDRRRRCVRRLQYTVPVISMPTYLEWLIKKCERSRKINWQGRGRREDLRDFLDSGTGYDWVVDCRGANAVELERRRLRARNNPKPLASPTEFVGDVLCLPCPNTDGFDIKKDFPHAIFVHTGQRFKDNPIYVIPRQRDVILGGTSRRLKNKNEKQVVLDGRAPADPGSACALFRRCASAYPVLREYAVAAGLDPDSRRPDDWTKNYFSYSAARPVRTISSQAGRPHISGPTVSQPGIGIRIGNTGNRIVHNYGHGGAGVTFSWGCAYEILRQLCQYDPTLKKSAFKLLTEAEKDVGE